ncbi:recombinase family protein, partial [Acinetobacter lactucae]
MTVRIYVRASTKDQDAERALSDLVLFANTIDSTQVQYIENHSGTKLERPQLNKLLSESEQGDTLLVESVDRLSRLTQKDFEVLKQRIKDKGLKLVVADLPTTHQTIGTSDDITGSILSLINNMLIDLLATMARLDNDKRKERIKQGLERSGYVPTGR